MVSFVIMSRLDTSCQLNIDHAKESHEIECKADGNMSEEEGTLPHLPKICHSGETDHIESDSCLDIRHCRDHSRGTCKMLNKMVS